MRRTRQSEEDVDASWFEPVGSRSGRDRGYRCRGLRDRRRCGHGATAKINVNASEFKFVLSKKTVPAGTTVIFTVVNKGKLPHDFKIGAKKTKVLKPGQKTLLTIAFPKKGTIAFLCTLPGHAQAGMKGKFGVGVAAPPPAPPPPTADAYPDADAHARSPRRCRATRSRARRSSPRAAVLRATRWRPRVQTATSARTST